MCLLCSRFSIILPTLCIKREGGGGQRLCKKSSVLRVVWLPNLRQGRFQSLASFLSDSFSNLLLVENATCEGWERWRWWPPRWAWASRRPSRRHCQGLAPSPFRPLSLPATWSKKSDLKICKRSTHCHNNRFKVSQRHCGQAYTLYNTGSLPHFQKEVGWWNWLGQAGFAYLIQGVFFTLGLP